MKTKHVEDFSIACMDEGSIPSDSTIKLPNILTINMLGNFIYVFVRLLYGQHYKA
jgi:hypothetical protein